MPALEFSRPAALLLLGLLIPVIWWARHSSAGLPRMRARLSLVLRCLIIVLLVLALAGLRLMVPSEQVSTIFLVDASLSASDTQQSWARNFVADAIKGMAPGDEAGVVLFGGDAWFERGMGELSARNAADPLPPFASAVTRDYTDISRGLLLAQGAFGEGGRRRIVLLSDGNENVGDAAREAGLAAERGIPVWTVPYPARAASDALVDGVEVPDVPRKDEPFDLRVHVRSSMAGPAVLVLERNGVHLGRIPVELHQGDNVFFIPQTLPRAGAFTWQVRVEAEGDANPRNNTAGAVAFVRGRARVLYVYGGAEGPGFVPGMLKAQGVEVEAVTPRHLPLSLAELQDYAAIIFSNVSAVEISEEQMRMLAAHARDMGGGFIMLGGPGSFGVGGYHETPVAEILPVRLDVRKRKFLPTVALVLVIDKSGSMKEQAGAVSKIGVAREAAIVTLDLLGAADLLGVVAFDEASKWLVSMRKAGRRQEIIDEVATLRAGGGTNLYPGLEDAYKALLTSNAAVKHIIVLSDGRTAPADFDGLVKKIKKANITVSCVGVGADADTLFMSDMAKKAGGMAYFTRDGTMLPRIFTRDAMLASRSAMVEEPFVPTVRDPHPILRGIASIPALGGYVMTTTRESARTPLLTHQGDPLLAAWRIGLGKSVAFTSDDGRRWARRWQAWPGAAGFFTQAVRWTFSEMQQSPLRVSTERRGGAVDLAVDAGDGNFLSLEATVVDPSAKVEKIKLRQTGPGRYRGNFTLGAPGSYVVSVLDRSSGQQRKLGLVFPYSPEYRDEKPNTFLMHRLAQVSGGRFNPRPDQVFERVGASQRVARDGWSLLALVALLLFPLDIALRRVFLPTGWPAKISGFFRRERQTKVDPGTEQTMAALKVRKREVEERARPAAPVLPRPAEPRPTPPEKSPPPRGKEAASRR